MPGAAVGVPFTRCIVYAEQKRIAMANGLSSNLPAVSVIVPVYNVERYVEQCVKSLCAQTLENIEIILVNDGSKDGSLAMLREAEARDSRVRVIDKPNGGYGAAVNRGLAEVRGEYVAIAEPDDFVDPHMYEDLYEAAHLKGGAMADVVKGSYWDYYDFPDAEPFLEAPNLMNCMPKQSFCAPVREQFEVLFHHPSIWSAIYKRSFLEDKRIRMIEPKGAGWADNPFFFETLLQAKTFVWVPAAYYYYRQTNPDASSNLRDYRLPFERLADIRALFKRLGVTDPQVIACLYSRTFSYIGSIIGEYGFDGGDPELHALIRDELAAMDPSILYGPYRGIRDEHRAYYELMTGGLAKCVRAHDEDASPQASVVVPVQNDRALLLQTLAALARQTAESFEVVCVDYGSTDGSAAALSAYAKKDKRFRLAYAQEQSVAGAVAEGFAAARSEAVLVTFPGVCLKPDCVDVLARLVRNSGAALAVRSAAAAATVASLSGEEALSALDPQGLRAEIATAPGFSLANCAFSRTFVQRSGVVYRNEDGRSGQVFALEALCRAPRVAFDNGSAASAVDARRAFGRPQAKRDLDLYRERAACLDAADCALAGLDDDAARALRCYAVACLLDDARLFAGSDDGEQIFNDVKRRFATSYGIAGAPRASYCNQDVFQRAELTLCSTYLHMLQSDIGRVRSSNSVLRQRCASIKESGSYRLGNAIVRATRKVLPQKIYCKLKG